MELIKLVIDVFLHLDHYLNEIITMFGGWTYFILFFIVFMETGLVVTPFLPGDSLLFAAGAICATSSYLNVWMLWPLVFIAAVVGDTVNYSLGKYIGPRVFSDRIPFLKKEHLERTQAFYEKHGGKTIFLARFVPIIRTFAPFVAGVGEMRYGYFITYNIVGAFVWTFLFTFGGYYFGNLKFVADNFSVVVLAIIVISLIPPVVEFLKGRKKPEIESSKDPEPVVE
ncbi:MAG: DedA family protein [Anaerolineaceae bacterium]|nr:DedA family protein [Anaerolineaceae bacterium]